MSKHSIVTNPSVSFQNAGDGTLTMIVHTDPIAGEAIEYVFGPRETISFLQSASQTSLYALRDAIDNLAIGPCEECQNYRLVTDDSHGRPNRIYCPSCNPRSTSEARSAAILAASPILHTTNGALQ